MMPFFSLIRFSNLLIIALTQYIMRFCIIQPIIKNHGFVLQMSNVTFFCLVLSTIFTAAAGYAINDYFDIKIDNINRPEDVIVGKMISRRKTMMIHIILSSLGVLLGGYVTWKAGVPLLVFLYIIVSGMLWLYSTTYKRQFLIGNIIVSLFTALVPMMVLLDIPLLNKAYQQQLMESGITFHNIIFYISCFSVFAFLTTLSREIIKDAEDFEGDTVYGCRSIPIVLGNNPTKFIIIGINALIICLLGIVFINFLVFYQDRFDYFTFFFLIVLIIFPLIKLSLFVYFARSNMNYRKAGNLMKFVMLAGICYALVICWRLRYCLPSA